MVQAQLLSWAWGAAESKKVLVYHLLSTAKDRGQPVSQNWESHCIAVLWHMTSSSSPTSQKISSSSVTMLGSHHIRVKMLNALNTFAVWLPLTNWQNADVTLLACHFSLAWSLFQEKITFPVKYKRYGLPLHTNLFSLSCFTYAILMQLYATHYVSGFLLFCPPLVLCLCLKSGSSPCS